LELRLFSRDEQQLVEARDGRGGLVHAGASG
jgi:hypothetical protein